MSAFYWWRSWHGAPMDPKWPVVAARAGVKVGVVSAVAWALMDYASQHKVRGTVEGFDPETYAVYSGFPEAEIVAVLKAMNDKGIIENGKLSNWEKRQPKREDDSRDRVTKFRELKRGVTQCNADTNEETQEGAGVTICSTLLSSMSESESVPNELKSDPNDWKPEEPPDIFDIYKRILETSGVLVNNAGAIKALDTIIGMGATSKDVEDGIAWTKDHKEGVIYASSIVKPCQVAMQMRLKSNGNSKQPVRVLRDADGNPCNENGDPL